MVMGMANPEMEMEMATEMESPETAMANPGRGIRCASSAMAWRRQALIV